MFYVIASIISLANIINLFSKKYYNWLPKLTLIFMFIMFIGSYNNPDSENYNQIFLESDSKDIGFNILISIAQKLHLNYQGFLIFIGIIGFSLIYLTINKFCENKSFICLIYFFYPFMLDIVQVRNFLSMTIFIYAVSFLVNYDRKNIVKYSLLIILASTIQLTSIIYLPFVLFMSPLRNTIKKYLLLAIIFLGVILSFIKPILSLIGSQISLITGDQRLEFYFSVNTKFGFLIPWIFQISLFLILRWIKIYIYKKNNISEIQLKYINLISKLNLYSLLFFPFYAFNSEFTRFSRNIMILYYIYIYIFNKSVKPRSGTKFLINIAFIILVSFMYLQDTIGTHGIEHVIRPIFESNYILDFFK